MLVLSRKAGERVCVGDSIQITVLDVGGGKVRLGFAAPLHVAIHREEVARRVEAAAAGMCDRPAAEIVKSMVAPASRSVLKKASVVPDPC